jgi:hypothetical protein
VPVELIGEAESRRRSEQAIRLGVEEWTAYAVSSPEARNYAATARVKAETTPAEFQVSLNGQTQEVTVTAEGWVELKLKPVEFAKGNNRLKLLVKQGAVSFDWLEFE